jgi:hypothetical protein
MIGTILFWNGIYNLASKSMKSSEHQFFIHLAAVLCGSIIVLYVIQLEDKSSDYISQLTTEFTMQDLSFPEARLCDMFCAYLGAFVCNSAQVILWWGVESFAEMHMMNRPLLAAGLFFTGLCILKLLDKLEVNLGIETESVDGCDENSSQCALVKFLLNTWELVSVVLIWTGFEWFFWDDFLFKDTTLRDSIYAISGFIVILVTGRLVKLMGVISPMGIYSDIHISHMHNEEPLLDRSMEYDKENSGDIYDREY